MSHAISWLIKKICFRDQEVCDYFKAKGCRCEGTEWKDDEGENCPGASDLQGYYQWVPYFLLIMGTLFYLPKIFWDYVEAGKMGEVTKGVLVGTVSDDKYEKALKEKGESVKKYLNNPYAGHGIYGWGYLAAQAMNLCVVLISFQLCDKFLGGEFRLLGFHFFRGLANGTHESILYILFPRHATCDFRSFGSGGHIKETSDTCIMALNTVSEKVFVTLWVWYLLLIVVNVCNLIVIVLMAVKSNTIRKLFIRRSAGSKKTGSDLRQTNLDRALNKYDFGQFLFLYFLGRNVDYSTFKAILTAIAGEQKETEEVQSVQSNDIMLQNMDEQGNMERRGSDLPGYSTLPHGGATKDPYPYPSLELSEKDTGDDEINASKTPSAPAEDVEVSKNL